MSREDVERFYKTMDRHLKGNLTEKERDVRRRAKETYDVIIARNGGKNPILGY